jgi:hypothetical protein
LKEGRGLYALETVPINLVLSMKHEEENKRKNKRKNKLYMRDIN